MPKLKLVLVLLALLLAPTAPAYAQARGSWALYAHPELGFRIDLPVAGFTPADSAPDEGDRLTLVETGGVAQIDVYGGHNDQGLGLAGFAERLEAADATRRVTYRAAGRSWFVLSGHFTPEAGSEELIFYTKFMLSADGTRYVAFEISYPRSEKRRFDPIVDRLEASLRRPA